jgi:tRNA(Ile)-lysidine synthase
VSAAEDATPISTAEAAALFDDLRSAPALVIAVSGGPDSTALLVLTARWRAGRKRGPALLAVTVDHGLRPESAREARAVKRLATQLGVRHRTLRWTGDKPVTALQEEARRVRYELLAAAARGAGAPCVLTAHTLDDQAETVLLRMARGSGISGLGAMARQTLLPTSAAGSTTRKSSPIVLVRPLLDLAKKRLIATLAAMGITFVDDPSNRDPRFTRPRLRALMPALADEGLDARRLATLARRMRRVDAGRSRSMPKNGAGCRPRCRCESWGGRSTVLVRRGRSSLGSLRPCMRRWRPPGRRRSACAGPWPGPW